MFPGTGAIGPEREPEDQQLGQGHAVDSREAGQGHDPGQETGQDHNEDQFLGPMPGFPGASVFDTPDKGETQDARDAILKYFKGKYLYMYIICLFVGYVFLDRK